jgi:hypothetical protein
MEKVIASMLWICISNIEAIACLKVAFSYVITAIHLVADNTN